MSDSKIVLVTGASRGIGAAISDAFGAQGYTVAGTATSENGAGAITARFTEKGYTGKGYCLNVTDAESIKQVLAEIKADFGDVAILVNNAGITKDNLFMRMKEDEWQSVMDTNLTSVFAMSKAVIKAMMRARTGRIINISSVVGSMGNAGQANYCAAKAGVEGFTRSLAREIGSRNITVNSIAPGFIQTDMTHELPEDVKENLMKQVPLNRLGSPEEIAHAALFLASDGASYITGETIHVNGGMYMG
ncbi:3-oxoacyl-ACP reductase FabG [Reinekea marinisedimentorum]|uniref:3-oxoacyl-[acyl-carrier-protein] reductase n=1 Tax=Reinekea marinisedimentorum TaxID=230495 RepID=A0A4R3I9K3_9GAMM|nr:3-oxoacyl-ACP reductase FabG [Reinekea marinisedimentorum]TCS42558.1 3-oxoacyl-[acyl-carrier protein] reductase [Reinekea marinisedimentorum]